MFQQPALRLAFLALAFLFSTTCLADTTIYLVRHAEKGDDDRSNPSLSTEGVLRAKALASALRSANIDACFATQYKRTQLTVEPTATAADTKVQVVQAGTEKKLVAKIQDEMADQHVLIAGHSNTVPNMLKAFGFADAPKLGESDYDDLFIVNIKADGEKSFLHLHYGARNPK